MMAVGILMVILNPIYSMTAEEFANPQVQLKQGLFGILALPLAIFSIIGYLTIAIGWHRLMLLGEHHDWLLVWPQNYSRWAYL